MIFWVVNSFFWILMIALYIAFAKLDNKVRKEAMEEKRSRLAHPSSRNNRQNFCKDHHSYTNDDEYTS